MSFETGDNFWMVHPELKAAGALADLHRKDKTRGKDQSSRIAWCIKLIWDRKSIYYGLPETGSDNKIDLVFTDFYGDKAYYKKNKEKILTLRDFYIKLFDTPAIRSLRNLEEKLHERDTFLKDTEYTLGERGDRGYLYGTADTLDKMMANTKKLYEQYEESRKAVEQEEAQSTKGDVTQSLSDEGKL
jgi:hypothetical protein